MSTVRAALDGDQQTAVWAALVALDQDVHAPQDNLTEAQWQAAEKLLEAIPDPPPDDEHRLVVIALAVMLGEVDAPDFSPPEWETVGRLLDEFTRAVEAQR